MKSPADFPFSRIKAIEEEIRILKKEFSRKHRKDPRFILLDMADLLQLFKISRRTAFTWRNNHILPYHYIGNRIYFRLSDIEIMLEKHRIPPRDKN